MIQKISLTFLSQVDTIISDTAYYLQFFYPHHYVKPLVSLDFIDNHHKNVTKSVIER